MGLRFSVATGMAARTWLPLWEYKSNQKFSTHILFWVRVPVLSEQIRLTDPSVSTDDNCLT